MIQTDDHSVVCWCGHCDGKPDVAFCTERLLARQWQPADAAPFAALNADPAVMAHFPAPLSKWESQRLFKRLRSDIAQNGWGMWALQLLHSGDFVGFVGLQPIPAVLHIGEGLEVAWRLAKSFWGAGYATEAARCAMQFGFERLGAQRMVAIAPLSNRRSRGVMERVGMYPEPTVLHHPQLQHAPHLRSCCVYTITAAQWRGLSASRL